MQLKVYFVDHNNRTTQFTDPRLNAQILTNILRKQTTTTTVTATITTPPPTITSSAAATTTAPAQPGGSGAATVSPSANPPPNAGAQPPVARPPPRPSDNMNDLPQGLLDSELLPKYRRDLVGKLRALRAELTALQPQSGHCRLEVSRNEVLEESYR